MTAPGFELTSQRQKVSRLPTEPPGRPGKVRINSHFLKSIPQSGGKMSKRLGGIIGCKYKTSSWHLNGFSDGSNIGSTVYYRRETLN